LALPDSAQHRVFSTILDLTSGTPITSTNMVEAGETMQKGTQKL